jgi:hypothetical protein
MKVKKYAEETRSIGLAQKLQAYKEATFGLTTQQGKTAFAFAAGSLAVLTPFMAQAQCGTGTQALNLTPGVPVFFNLNYGHNDLQFKGNAPFVVEMLAINGAKLYNVAGYAKGFNFNDVINNNANFATGQNYLCYFGSGPLCPNGSAYLGIKLGSGKVGFIKITRTNWNSYTIDKALSGVSVSTTPTSVKAGDCASLSAALPVELTHFSAKPMSQHINLSWSTASEKNNAYFAIERSRNGVDFSPIGQVKGNGTTQSAHDYGFVDTDVATEGVYYYRLKQVDTDGTATYSAVLSAQLKDATQVKVYPTAVRHNVVNIETSNDKQPTTVVDMTGRVLKQFATTPNQINVSDLAVGVYMVRVGSQVTRIVKAN